MARSQEINPDSPGAIIEPQYIQLVLRKRLHYRSGNGKAAVTAVGQVLIIPDGITGTKFIDAHPVIRRSGEGMKAADDVL